MFKVSNKETVFIVKTYFTPFSGVSFVNFEQLNASWVKDSVFGSVLNMALLLLKIFT